MLMLRLATQNERTSTGFQCRKCDVLDQRNALTIPFSLFTFYLLKLVLYFASFGARDATSCSKRESPRNASHSGIIFSSPKLTPPGVLANSARVWSARSFSPTH